VPDIAPAPAYACEYDVCCEDSADAEEEAAVIRSDTRFCHHQKSAVSPPSCLSKQPILPAILAFAHDCPDRLWLFSCNLRL